MTRSGHTGQWLRLALDLGPLVVFFGTFQFFEHYRKLPAHQSIPSQTVSSEAIFPATGFFMAAVLLALGIGYIRERRISPMPMITAVLVLVFGALTLYLRNDIFIKMKPTVLYALFSLLLAGGLACNRLLIRYVFSQAFELDDPGWRALTWRWAAFFLGLAALNELVWRNFPTSVWVSFKVWAIIPLIFLFALAQTPLILRRQIEAEGETDQEPE